MKTTLMILILTFAAPVMPAGAASRCGAKHGEAYIICKETGGNPKYMRPNAEHPGPSSARGPYGLLAATRRTYGTAQRYMQARYGTWEKAESFHRAHNWW